MFKRIASAFIVCSLVTAAAAYAKPQTMTVKMRAENKSGETGTAQLMQLPNGVQVKITLADAPAAAQPAHIHEGTCQQLNPAPKVMLTSVTGGTSTTFVKGAKLSDWTSGKYAINVHKSTSDLKTYVACGAIK
jgi:Cu/Zn superoxide dismutase